MEVTKGTLMSRSGLKTVLSTGGRGEDSPPNTPVSPPPPQHFCELSLTKSYNVLAKNLCAISQLQGPRNCLRMPQNHSQKAQNSKNFWVGMPLGNCGLCLQPPSTITFNIFPPKTKVLVRTLKICHKMIAIS